MLSIETGPSIVVFVVPKDMAEAVRCDNECLVTSGTAASQKMHGRDMIPPLLCKIKLEFSASFDGQPRGFQDPAPPLCVQGSAK